jgi:hypothetical protein
VHVLDPEHVQPSEPLVRRQRSTRREARRECCDLPEAQDCVHEALLRELIDAPSRHDGWRDRLDVDSPPVPSRDATTAEREQPRHVVEGERAGVELAA